MTVFVDSSALVKRYGNEAGYDAVRGITEPMAASALARVEVPSALWRKRRRHELSDGEVAALLLAFELEWFGDEVDAPLFAVVRVTKAILDEAATQVARHGLRAYDGVQLATALAVRAIEPGADVLAAFDVELRAAAATEGFTLLPPTLGAGD